MTFFNDYWFIGITILIVLAIIVITKRKSSARELKQKLEALWGKVPAGQYKDEDMSAIKSYYENLRENSPGVHFIDNITWNDLDMDNVFKRINSTQTSAGEEYLYNVLRKPEFDKKNLEERGRVIEYFRTNPEERKKLQFALGSLGKNRFCGVTDKIFNTGKNVKTKRLLYILLALALYILTFYTIFISPQTGLGLLVISFLANATVYYRAKNEMAHELESLNYIIGLVGCANKIGKMDSNGLQKYTKSLASIVKVLKKVNNRAFFVISKSTDPIMEYMKVILLVELIAYESTNKFVCKHIGEIKDLFETIGFLDSMLSIASYRESIDFFSTPELFYSKDIHTAALSMIDIYHPLVKKPVANTAIIGKPVLLTGSNASGKSTFLKTVAINAIFAQTIYTCLAGEYKSCFYKIFTSMALRDDLSSNESYYIAEIKSLKRIFDNLDNEIPLLCIIDEVLRGTNTIERIAASSEVLHNLTQYNCLCIAATHDIELTSILNKYYENFHFQESFENNEIVFDYKLYSGKSETRNAIKLLKVMGYEDKIVKAAEHKAESFMLEGKWQAV